MTLSTIPTPYGGPFAPGLLRRLPAPPRKVALLRRHGGTLVLLGDADAQPSARALKTALPDDRARRCRDLTGATTLPELGAVSARLAVLVTNDSGPAHIAYALGTPAVSIFGGSNPATNGPPRDGPFRVVQRDVLCRPPGSLLCSACAYDHRCLSGVTVADALAAAEQVIGTGGTLDDPSPAGRLDRASPHADPHTEGACHAPAR